MKALLLCAGIGSRLHPITEHLPKALVPINGKPLLEYWLDQLSRSGITEFLINTHHHEKQIYDFIKSSNYRDSVKLFSEKELLNTAGTVFSLNAHLKDEDFMLIHADNLSICNFNTFIKTHFENKKAMTMMLFKTDTPESCGIVETDKDGIVIKFYEKVKNPPSNLANGAVYICSPNVIEFIVKNDLQRSSFSTEVIPHFLGEIATWENRVYHRDIGTPESYGVAQVEIFINNPLNR